MRRELAIDSGDDIDRRDDAVAVSATSGFMLGHGG